MISDGASASIRFVVDDESTAIALRSGDVPVLGTPKVVALVEEAAVAAISDSLSEGETSVGSHIAIDHVSPTLTGATVVAEAVVTNVKGRQVSFSVTVRENDKVVASGSHARVVVDRERFAAL